MTCSTRAARRHFTATDGAETLVTVVLARSSRRRKRNGATVSARRVVKVPISLPRTKTSVWHVLQAGTRMRRGRSVAPRANPASSSRHPDNRYASLVPSVNISPTAPKQVATTARLGIFKAQQEPQAAARAPQDDTRAPQVPTRAPTAPRGFSRTASAARPARRVSPALIRVRLGQRLARNVAPVVLPRSRNKSLALRAPRASRRLRAPR